MIYCFISLYIINERESSFPLGLVFWPAQKKSWKWLWTIRFWEKTPYIYPHTDLHKLLYHPLNVWYIYHWKTRTVCSSAAQWEWTSIISINVCFSLACQRSHLKLSQYIERKVEKLQTKLMQETHCHCVNTDPIWSPTETVMCFKLSPK